MKKLIALVLVVGACSPMTTSVDGGTGGGGLSAAGGGTSSAGGTASAGGSATGGGSTGPTRIGTVLISQSTIEVGTQSFRSGFVLANFFEIPAAFPGCTTTTIGACTVSNCAAAADAGQPPDGGRVSAGVVSVTGVGADGGVTLAPMELGYQATISGPVFAPGATLGVSTTGATVPAFTAQVAAPSASTLTMPVCTATTCPPISKATGLSLAWTGGVGTFSVQLLAGAEQVSCEFPASQGSGTIPAAALAALPTGMASILVNTQNATTVQAGPFPVRVTAAESKGFGSSIAP